MDDAHRQVLTLKTIGQAIEIHKSYLEAMSTNNFTPGIAWTARNLLELAVWTRYCLSSERNAKTFFQDAARDSISVMDLPQEVLKPSKRESFKQIREQLLKNAAEDQIESPDIYTRVANAAREMNTPYFGKINMILSKWAHPTALSVFSHRDTYPELNKLFYDLGLGWANTSIAAIKQFLDVELAN
jgi:hypothetical protein